MRKGSWNAQKFVEYIEVYRGLWRVFGWLLTKTNRLIKGKPVLRL